MSKSANAYNRVHWEESVSDRLLRHRIDKNFLDFFSTF